MAISYKRQLNGLNKYNFENKKDKQIAKYLTKKYELLGIKVPKYLQKDKLTKGDINRAIDRIKTTLDNKINKEYTKNENKINKQLTNTVKKYNKMIDLTMEGMKGMGLTSLEMAYLTGKDITLPNIRRKTFVYDGIAIKYINEKRLHFASVVDKVDYINKLKKDMKSGKMSWQYLFDILNDDSANLNWFTNVYLNSNVFEDYDSNKKMQMLRAFKTLTPLQQEFYIKSDLSELVERYKSKDISSNEEKIPLDLYERFFNMLDAIKEIK